MFWFKKREPKIRIKPGDRVRITGHTGFHGGDILPIGSEITVKHVYNPFHGWFLYKWNDLGLDWLIGPEDYEIIKEAGE